MTLKDRISQAINTESAENGSDTPDFILANFLTDCLAAWDRAIRAREKWYQKKENAHECGKAVEEILGFM